MLIRMIFLVFSFPKRMLILRLLILQEIVITVRLMPDFSQCTGELVYLFSYWGRLGDVEQGAVELLR